MNSLKTIITIAASIALSVFSLSAQAQKTVQESAVWAPDNIKADGKLNEWGDNLQAFNKATQVYYTMANDNQNLYIAMRSANQNAANKIVAGGLNLTINAAGKKSDKDAVVIVFPTPNIASLSNRVAPAVRQPGETGRPQVDNELIAEIQKAAIEAAKEIRQHGIKEIADTSLSIYNQYGIKAGISYDAKGNLLYELVVPLKYLHLTDGTAFAYNIKVNGIGGDTTPRGGVGGGFIGTPPVVEQPNINRNATNFNAGSGGSGGAFTSGPGSSRPADMIDLQDMMNSTDFWGKYTPAKK